MATGVLNETIRVLPKSHEISLAEKASAEIGPFLSRDGKKDVKFVLKRTDQKKEIGFVLPHTIVNLLARTLIQIARGNAVTIVPIHAELSTQEAANLLNVSRPYLIQLLERKRIPFHTVGRHRRIKFEDLLDYKERSKEKSLKRREDLTEEAQSLDLGY